ncbi:MAG: 4-(cytidine 5'-diphospho)-2-C-methyl-D-erythritol kinase [Gemmatimonadota bacterium]
MRVIVAAPAKVNLWLRVGPPLSSGFHALDTLFCGLDLADTVTVTTRDDAETSELEVSHAAPLETTPSLGPEWENLALRAARAFEARARRTCPVHIQLVKRIPAGAGLGGGSSDAAAVLRALNRLHPQVVSPDDLMAAAVQLGSDVPFFAANRPLALGAGRGETLRALPPLPPRPVVLVLPELAIHTGGAYRWLDEARAEQKVAELPAEPPDPGELTWDVVAERAGNDFEAVVFDRYPVLAEIRDGLRAGGAIPALLAGSGASLFGVFADADAADAAAEALAVRWPGLRIVRTTTRAR